MGWLSFCCLSHSLVLIITTNPNYNSGQWWDIKPQRYFGGSENREAPAYVLSDLSASLVPHQSRGNENWVCPVPHVPRPTQRASEVTGRSSRDKSELLSRGDTISRCDWLYKPGAMEGLWAGPDTTEQGQWPVARQSGLTPLWRMVGTAWTRVTCRPLQGSAAGNDQPHTLSVHYPFSISYRGPTSFYSLLTTSALVSLFSIVFCAHWAVGWGFLMTASNTCDIGSIQNLNFFNARIFWHFLFCNWNTVGIQYCIVSGVTA